MTRPISLTSGPIVLAAYYPYLRHIRQPRGENISSRLGPRSCSRSICACSSSQSILRQSRRLPKSDLILDHVIPCLRVFHSSFLLCHDGGWASMIYCNAGTFTGTRPLVVPCDHVFSLVSCQSVLYALCFILYCLHYLFSFSLLPVHHRPKDLWPQ